MAFSFGFGGDDIEAEDREEEEGAPPLHLEDRMSVDAGAAATGEASEDARPRTLRVEELLPTLPSSLSFRWHRIPTDYGPGSYTTSRYPRRDLSDIRAQILSTADPTTPLPPALSAGLVHTTGDLSSGVYEGGFKTWECSNDLAWWMLERSPGARDGDVVELGAGTALPSCVVFEGMLREGLGGERSGDGNKEVEGRGRSRAIVVADFNEEVLRLASWPNLWLTWYVISQEVQRARGGEEELPADGVGAMTSEQQDLEDGYVEVTDALKQAFLFDMQRLGIKLSFISGSWGPEFSSLVQDALGDEDQLEGGTAGGIRTRCVLASETIYSPQTLDVFTETLLRLINSGGDGSQAMIAAKRIYFGVGGGVDEFKRRLHGGQGFEGEWEGGTGVGRWIGMMRKG